MIVLLTIAAICSVKFWLHEQYTFANILQQKLDADNAQTATTFLVANVRQRSRSNSYTSRD